MWRSGYSTVPKCVTMQCVMTARMHLVCQVLEPELLGRGGGMDLAHSPARRREFGIDLAHRALLVPSLDLARPLHELAQGAM